MKLIEIIQIILFFGLGIALTPPVGRFMARVYKGERTFLHPIFHPMEKLIYRLTGIDPAEEMTWLKYFWAVMLFACVSFASDMVIFMTQHGLPLNPQKLPNCTWHLAFMQAWSFTCNADWQSYAGETTMSYFSQVFAIMMHQFLSGAVGSGGPGGGRAGLEAGDDPQHWQFLGGPDSRASLFRDTAFGGLGHSAGLAGRSPDLEAVPNRQSDGVLYHPGAKDR